MLLEAREKINKFKESGGLDTLSMLRARWQDEKQYEDIVDYKKHLEKNYPFLNIVKMQKRPFGFIFKVGSEKILFASKVKGQYLHFFSEVK